LRYLSPAGEAGCAIESFVIAMKGADRCGNPFPNWGKTWENGFPRRYAPRNDKRKEYFFPRIWAPYETKFGQHTKANLYRIYFKAFAFLSLFAQRKLEPGDGSNELPAGSPLFPSEKKEKRREKAALSSGSDVIVLY